MTSFQLDTFLSGHVFAFLLVFARVGSVMMLFPGIGEAYVSARMRLMLALWLSVLMLGPLLPRLPPPPAQMPELARLLVFEIMIGLFFGTLLRLSLSVLETTGTMIGIQTGLSNATILNPALAAQSPLPSALLSIIGLTLIFVTGLDHMILRSIVGLYDAFPAGGELMPGDMAQAIIQGTAHSFLLGVELAMPFFVMGLLMYVALGLMQRLMPSVQLFLVGLPVQIWGGLTLLGVTLASIMLLWLQSVDATLAPLVTP